MQKQTQKSTELQLPINIDQSKLGSENLFLRLSNILLVINKWKIKQSAKLIAW